MIVSFAGGNEVVTIDLEKKKVINKLRTGEGPAGVVFIPGTKFNW